ncbi:basic proline-rich protein-like [Pseudopipra pipra]|uniref:basic proline-rich protein-like n=1 Tax=Pseudopipra pipra TaxID=415032 RepID=UPI00313982C8
MKEDLAATGSSAAAQGTIAAGGAPVARPAARPVLPPAAPGGSRSRPAPPQPTSQPAAAACGDTPRPGSPPPPASIATPAGALPTRGGKVCPAPALPSGRAPRTAPAPPAPTRATAPRAPLGAAAPPGGAPARPALPRSPPRPASPGGLPGPGGGPLPVFAVLTFRSMLGAALGAALSRPSRRRGPSARAARLPALSGGATAAPATRQRGRGGGRAHPPPPPGPFPGRGPRPPPLPAAGAAVPEEGAGERAPGSGRLPVTARGRPENCGEPPAGSSARSSALPGPGQSRAGQGRAGAAPPEEPGEAELDSSVTPARSARGKALGRRCFGALPDHCASNMYCPTKLCVSQSEILDKYMASPSSA